MSLDDYNYNKKTYVIIFSRNDPELNRFLSQKDELCRIHNLSIYEQSYTKYWVPDLRVFFVIDHGQDKDILEIFNRYIIFRSFRHKKTGTSMYIFGEVYTQDNINFINHFPSDEENSYIIYEKKSIKEISDILNENNVNYEWSMCSKIKDAELSQKYIDSHWYLNNSNVLNAWKRLENENVSKVSVAIYDDGFDLSHSAIHYSENVHLIKECNFHNDIAGKYTREDNNPTARPNDTHGTRVATICLGRTATIGIAPKSRFIPMAIRYYSYDKDGKKINLQVTSNDLIHYFHQEAMTKSDIVLCSWVFFFKLTNKAYQYINNISKIKTFVVAAGNYAQNVTNDHYGFYDLGKKDVILVGAAKKNGLPTCYTNYGKQVKLYAVAGSIFSSNNNYLAGMSNNLIGKYNNLNKYFKNAQYHNTETSSTNGTSFAAPIVAGLAALMKSVCPNLSPEQIKNILYDRGDSMLKIYNKTKKDSLEFIKETENERSTFISIQKKNRYIEPSHETLFDIVKDDPHLINADRTIEYVIKMKNYTEEMPEEPNVIDETPHELHIYIKTNNNYQYLRTIKNAIKTQQYNFKYTSDKDQDVIFVFRWINIAGRYQDIELKYKLKKSEYTINHKFQ